MEVQKLSSLKQRQAAWKARQREAWLTAGTLWGLSTLIFSAAALALRYTHHFGEYNNAAPWLIVLSVAAWCLGLSIPVYLISNDAKPTERDVYADQALRRAFGMDDAVSLEGNTTLTTPREEPNRSVSFDDRRAASGVAIAPSEVGGRGQHGAASIPATGSR